MRTFIFALLMLTASASFAAPLEILMIRHAEKPTTGDEGSDLSEKGYKRAQALVDFFTTNPKMIEHGQADFIFAGAPKKVDGSQRPFETIKPTADKLGLKVNTDYESKDYDQLADDLLNDSKYDGKVVIICWPHDELPDFAAALKVDETLDWPGTIFDRVWKITYDGKKVSKFEDLPQHLLKGDSAR